MRCGYSTGGRIAHSNPVPLYSSEARLSAGPLALYTLDNSADIMYIYVMKDLEGAELKEDLAKKTLALAELSYQKGMETGNPSHIKNYRDLIDLEIRLRDLDKVGIEDEKTTLLSRAEVEAYHQEVAIREGRRKRRVMPAGIRAKSPGRVEHMARVNKARRDKLSVLSSANPDTNPQSADESIHSQNEEGGVVGARQLELMDLP